MMESSKAICTAVFLSLLISTPPFLMIGFEGGLRIISTETTTSVAWETNPIKIEGLDAPKQVIRVTTVEKWSDGRTRVCLSSHILLNDSTCKDMWFNMSSWVPDELEPECARRATIPLAAALADEAFTPYSVDNLYFIGTENNGTHWTSHDHDNNYHNKSGQGYYPGMWDYAYALSGANKTHVHMSSSFIYEWLMNNVGNASAKLFALVLGDLVGKLQWLLTGATMNEIVSAIAAELGAPELVVIWLAYDLYKKWDAWAQFIGYVTTALWIYFVVEERFAGDAWTWRSPIISPGWFIIVWEPYFLRPATCFDYYQVRVWNQTFGSEGIFGSTHDCIASWWDHIQYSPQGPGNSMPR